MKIHPRERELLIGTHGRGVFVLPVQKIEEMTPEVLDRELHAFEPEEVVLPAERGEAEAGPEPKAVFLVYTKTGGAGKLVVKDSSGKVLKEIKADYRPGLNDLTWDLRAEGQKEKVRPGEYQVEFYLGQLSQSKKLKVSTARFSFMELPD